MKMKLSLLTFCLAAIAWSCSSDDDGNQVNIPAPAEIPDTEGNGTVSFDDGDVTWYPTDFTGSLIGDTIKLEAENGDEYFKLSVEAGGTGYFPVSGSDINISAQLKLEGAVEFNTVFGGSGTVVVEEFSAQKVSGSFIINDMQNIAGDKKTLTNGTFEFEPGAVAKITFSDEGPYKLFKSSPVTIPFTVSVEPQEGTQVTLIADHNIDGLNITVDPQSGSGTFNGIMRVNASNVNVDEFSVSLRATVDGVTVSTASADFEVEDHPLGYLAGNFIGLNQEQNNLPRSYAEVVVPDVNDDNAVFFRDFGGEENSNLRAVWTGREFEIPPGQEIAGLGTNNQPGLITVTGSDQFTVLELNVRVGGVFGFGGTQVSYRYERP